MQSLVRTRSVASVAASRPVGRVFAPVIECKASDRKECTAARHKRIRKKVTGTTDRPRLAVHRSNEHIYAQVIDDSNGTTLVSASTVMKEIKSQEELSTSTVAAAEAVGKKIAELCKTKNIETVRFDRGGFRYHGRVKAVADAARAGGLVF